MHFNTCSTCHATRLLSRMTRISIPPADGLLPYSTIGYEVQGKRNDGVRSTRIQCAYFMIQLGHNSRAGWIFDMTGKPNKIKFYDRLAHPQGA